MFVLIGVAHDSNFSLCGPGKQLLEVIDDDRDQRKVKVCNPRSKVGLIKAAVEVMRRQQVTNHVNGFVVDLGFSKKIRRENCDKIE